MAALSLEFKRALLVDSRLRGRRMYEHAQHGGLSPSTLSAMVHDARPVGRGDPRIVKIGKRLGLTAAQCVASEQNLRRGRHAAEP